MLRGIASTSNYAPPSIVLAGERDSGISFGTPNEANDEVTRAKASARLLAALENGGRALFIEAALFSHRATGIPFFVRERFWEGVGSLLVILISLFALSKNRKRRSRGGRRK